MNISLTESDLRLLIESLKARFTIFLSEYRLAQKIEDEKLRENILEELRKIDAHITVLDKHLTNVLLQKGD